MHKDIIHSKDSKFNGNHSFAVRSQCIGAWNAVAGIVRILSVFSTFR
jgi:hypothetical protein